MSINFQSSSCQTRSRVGHCLRSFTLLVLLCGVVHGTAAVGQEPAGVTGEQVQQAIQKARAAIEREQLPHGNWPDRDHYAGGLSPLATLSLLHAGVPQEGPVMQLALKHLQTIEPHSTYTTALQTMVFCYADPKRFQHLIARNVQWLEARQVKTGTAAGMWSTPVSGSPDHIDNSMTHFAMLALYEAERVGVSVSPEVWELALAYWLKAQNGDGSWGWGPGYPGSGSMTSAGIAAILIASGQTATGEAVIKEGQIQCCGEQTPQPAVDRALRWLERNFSVTRNPNWQYWHSYYLYSMERAGRLTGQRLIGQHDWYREGAEMLVKTQTFSGLWPTDLDSEYVDDPLVSTCFSLMFLSKARRPIVLARLQHGDDQDWNRHRGSLTNLVTTVEKLWGQELTHQVVELSKARVEDLLEAPVLFLNGSQVPEFTPEEKTKLRQYVDRGGFLFAERCCDGEFDAGFRKLMRELFPESPLTALPATHPVWFAQKPVGQERGRELWGIDIGCRTAVVYSPQDLSCYWELGRPGRERLLTGPPGVLIAEAQAIGANVLAYATNREVKFRDPTLVGATPPSNLTAKRGGLQIAKVLHLGGCDAAPQAIPNLLRVAEEKYGLPAGGEALSLRLTDPALFEQQLLLFSGRSEFQLTPIERQQLRTFVSRGGTIFSDAIASSAEFAAAFRKEMELVFPDTRLAPIPRAHALFGTEFGGTDVRTVQRRQLAESLAGMPLQTTYKPGEPLLEGILQEERYVVLFSPLDLSCSLDSQSLVSFPGYDRADAARIAVNVLYYLLLQ